MSRPATSRLKVNPPLGQLPVLQYCSPDQLLIDEQYQRSLDAFPALHVFGFTARDPVTDEIGAHLYAMAASNWARFSVRFSGMQGSVMASRLADAGDPEAIICPAQTGKTDCCATCALCWHSDRSVAFRRL